MEGVNVPILKLFHLELDYYQKIIYSENYTKNVFLNKWVYGGTCTRWNHLFMKTTISLNGYNSWYKNYGKILMPFWGTQYFFSWFNIYLPILSLLCLSTNAEGPFN